MSDFILPTNPVDLQKIEDAIKEASNSRLRIDAERELIKDIRIKLKEESGMPPKIFNKLLNVYHKQNYEEVASENEAVNETYEKIFG